MRRALILFVLAAALVASGCGSSSSTSTSSAARAGGRYPAAGATNAATAASGAASVPVALKNISFQPGTINAKVGQTVVWTNMDNTDHNVTAESGATFKSSDFGQGQTYSQKLTKAGTITYECTIHQGMTGKIVVTAS